MQIRSIVRRLGAAAALLGVGATTSACSEDDGLQARPRFEADNVIVLAFSEEVERPQDVPVDAFRLSLAYGARDLRLEVVEYGDDGQSSTSVENYTVTYYSAVQTPGFAACQEQCYEDFDGDCEQCEALDRNIKIEEVRPGQSAKELELVLSEPPDPRLCEYIEYLEDYLEQYSIQAGELVTGFMIHHSAAAGSIRFTNGETLPEQGQSWVERRDTTETDYAVRYDEFFPEFASPLPIPCET